MGVDLALPCGLILNESKTIAREFLLIDVNTSKSLGLRLVRLLAHQIHGSFEVRRS